MGFDTKSNGTKQKKESILFRTIFVFCFRIVLVLLQISFFILIGGLPKPCLLLMPAVCF